MQRQRAIVRSRGWCRSAALVATEAITNGWAVHWHIGIVVVSDGVPKVVAAATGERLVPVALDKFQDRDVVAVAVQNGKQNSGAAGGRAGRQNSISSRPLGRFVFEARRN
jgi:hypothetical protein